MKNNTTPALLHQPRSGFEQLFGSKVRVQLLRLFLENPKDIFFVRELERKIGAHINAIRRELQNLLALDIIATHETKDGKEHSIKKRYYKVKLTSVLFQELQNLFLKFHLFSEQNLAKKALETGMISYLALTGSLVGMTDSQTDIVIIGKIDKGLCRKLLHSFEKDIGRPINYTLMTENEYLERKRLTDRFLYKLLEQKKIILVDHLKNT